jgi:hypothetical protein
MMNPGAGDPAAFTATQTLVAMEPGTRWAVDLPVADDLNVPVTLLRGMPNDRWVRWSPACRLSRSRSAA